MEESTPTSTEAAIAQEFMNPDGFLINPVKQRIAPHQVITREELDAAKAELKAEKENSAENSEPPF